MTQNRATCLHRKKWIIHKQNKIYNIKVSHQIYAMYIQSKSKVKDN